jgi:hypothetical protein
MGIAKVKMQNIKRNETKHERSNDVNRELDYMSPLKAVNDFFFLQKKLHSPSTLPAYLASGVGRI